MWESYGLCQLSVCLNIYIRNTVGFLVKLMSQVYVQIQHFAFYNHVLQIARYNFSGELRNCWSIRVTIVAVEKE
jgi:hypothetical protein